MKFPPLTLEHVNTVYLPGGGIPAPIFCGYSDTALVFGMPSFLAMRPPAGGAPQ